MGGGVTGRAGVVATWYDCKRYCSKTKQKNDPVRKLLPLTPIYTLQYIEIGFEKLSGDVRYRARR